MLLALELRSLFIVLDRVGCMLQLSMSAWVSSHDLSLHRTCIGSCSTKLACGCLLSHCMYSFLCVFWTMTVKGLQSLVKSVLLTQCLYFVYMVR